MARTGIAGLDDVLAGSLTRGHVLRITYLADTVIPMRYFEAMGHVRRAISVIKNRSGEHESAIREIKIGLSGIILGEPLTAFSGGLRGVPTYSGAADPLLSAVEP